MLTTTDATDPMDLAITLVRDTLGARVMPPPQWLSRVSDHSTDHRRIDAGERVPGAVAISLLDTHPGAAAIASLAEFQLVG